MKRARFTVTGVVQGVGFRPFVYGLAARLGLAGFVGNDSAGVFIEAEGEDTALERFGAALKAEPPPLAHIETITVAPLPPQGATEFIIVASTAQVGAATLVSPDLCTCDDCLHELLDPQDRRYRYPFTNCTNCGPRFTITRDIPYDRPLTTMAPFVMCPACQREYDDPLNRRFHAQPNACSTCGPQLTWRGQDGAEGEAALQAARAALASGQIVAVKGLGGFHLACDATSSVAVATLRKRKGRVDKPFAVMATDLAAVECAARLDNAGRLLLTSRERPIVLLPKRDGSPLAELVAPGNQSIGMMLPYTPLHALLLQRAELPEMFPSLLVMTSGNYSNEPIVTSNEEALAQLSDLADGFLLHDREIYVPCDDSVVRVFDGEELPIRRSRGYAPFPVTLPFDSEPILAVGGELKATFCLTRGHHAFMSQHIGDMENLETLHTFEHAVAHMERLFRIEPQRIACDLHPGYLSTRWAQEHAGGRPVVPVQHHHAHIAAVMAEHGLDGAERVIGFAFDGTGYGTDGAIWGGEVLIADYRSFTRAGHLAYVPLPGGDAAIKRPYRIALAHLHTAGMAWDDALPPVVACPEVERKILLRQLETGLNAVPTSSMGRLFDAVAALIGLRQTVTYEGQAAIELEAQAQAAPEEEKARYRFGLDEEKGTLRFDSGPLIRAIGEDVKVGAPAAVIALRFHRAVAELILDVSLALRARHGHNTVVLSGGVLQNVLLLRLAVDRLQQAQFDVRRHRRVPPNDGGLALGQAAVAQHQQR
jgi:hydrogenase maturation protein HypF